MADLSYTVDVNTSNAQKNLDALQKKVEKVNATFGKLRDAIAGIAVVSAIAHVNKFADAISDLSDATNISITAITQFGKAALENGGDVDSANTSLLKFTQTIGEAADGAKTAQLALEDVGITLKDLKTLSEEELLKKTVKGLSGIEDTTKRMITQVAIFGKNARNLNFAGMGDSFGPASADAVKYASAIKSGADAQQAMEVNMKNLTQALLNVIQPLNDIAKTVNISVGAFESLVKSLTYAIAAYLALTKGLALVRAGMGALEVALVASGGVFAFLSGQISLIILNVVNFGKNLLRMVGIIGGGTTALFSFAAAGAAVLRVLLRFAGIVGIVMAVAEAVNFLSKLLFDFDILDYITDKFSELYEVAKRFFGLKSSSPDQSEAETKRLQAQADAAKKQGEAVRETTDAWAKQRKELELVSEAFKKQNTDIIRALGTEKESIGKSKEYVDLLKAQEEISNRAADEIKKLQDAKSLLSKEDAKLAPLYDEQIAKIQKLAVIDGERIATQVKDLNKLQNAEQLRQYGISQQIDLAKQLQSIEDDYAKMTMTELEKKYYDIEAAAKASALAAIQAEEARRGAKLSAEEEQKYYDIALAGTKKLQDESKKLYDRSREFNTGWTNAFNEYMDNATNAANRARDVFSSVTSNMERMIDNFVDTGKLSFGDFATSVIKDLLKIELKAATMNLWKSMGGGGGGGGLVDTAISWGKKLLGFAGGGNPPIGQASIVGENGPELITPRTAQTVIPLGGAGGQQVVNNYYTVNAVDAKSVAQLFAENRRVLLGTVRLAEKEMPTRR